VQVASYLEDSSVRAEGALSVNALATQSIDSLVVSGSVALAIGGTAGVAVAGSGVFAENVIGVDLKSYIDGDGDSGTVGIVADSIEVTADDRSTIRALAAAVSIAASGGTVGVSAAIGISLARNTITSDVEAYIDGADGLAGSLVDFGITARDAGGITVRATETASIRALSAAAAIAAGFGGGGVAVAGAGADANNVILTGTRAHVDGSSLSSAGKVDIDAKNDARIQAAVISASVAIGVGIYAGVGASIGVAIARNYIGWTNDPDTAHTYTTASSPASISKDQTVKIASGAAAGNVYRYIGDTPLTRPSNGTAAENERWLVRQNYFDKSKWELVSLDPDVAEVKAYIVDSQIDATGALTVDAVSDQAIDATVFAGSVALSGGIVGASLSGAGAASENRIAALVQSYIEGDKDGKGIKAAGVSVKAQGP